MYRVIGFSAVLAMSSLLFAQDCLADLLAADYFDYGTSTGTTLGDQGTATNGFSGAWVDTSTNVAGRSTSFDGSADELLEYVPNTALTFSNANYDNSYNAGGTIQQGTGSQLNYCTTYRSFSSGLSGTIWMSALVEFAADSTSNDMLIWFEPSTAHWSGANAVGTFSSNSNGTNSGAVVKYNNVYSNTADYYVSADTTFLLLAKLDVTSGADSITFWMKTESDDLSSEVALGTALYSLSGTDILGATFDRIGISMGNGAGQFDALRIGETLVDVTAVPEPSTVALVLMGLLAVVVFRRRR